MMGLNTSWDGAVATAGSGEEEDDGNGVEASQRPDDN